MKHWSVARRPCENFVIFDSEVDFEVPIIFGRPFLSTGCAVVDMEKGSMKHESDLKSVSVVNYKVEKESKVSIEERLGVNALAAVMINFDSDGIDDYDDLVATRDRFQFHFKPKWLELDMKN
ncbi:hypothetical protein H5410_035911 [Solanum commersonii]|uniref:Uncharacterized protein n=1 Tax=Solanum commersonii TaxID=4109 RepID=A0A9J5Y467_SOLCO|nr:hypothetical protein H5410_035911 [Solanum commersonii]